MLSCWKVAFKDVWEMQPRLVTEFKRWVSSHDAVMNNQQPRCLEHLNELRDISILGIVVSISS